ncbi:MAG: D-lyxose ketol-isomerase [Verrucomicrobiota bacterium]|nr:D-lyxose ketol-isomerase [Verrucomicrobiota bacterium]MDK2964254.1 D-lyxose ketol-isomerase [Verrucomicrobiota bacterium]
MSAEIKKLSTKAQAAAAERYAALYKKALPGSGGIEKSRIEIATFNRSSTLEEFQKVGLGLETVVIFRDESGLGHTGKILMNLPGQLLLEHSHVDTFVLRKEATLPDEFIKLSELINGFRGIVQYNSDGSVICDPTGNPQYIYPETDYQTVQAKDGLTAYPAGQTEDIVKIFPGKSETFKAIYGDGVLFADTAQVVYTPPGINPDQIPEKLLPLTEEVRNEQAITTKRMIYLTQGMNVLLPKNTRHAFLGGLNGCVYLEFSTPSMDEADRYTDKRVIR